MASASSSILQSFDWLGGETSQDFYSCVLTLLIQMEIFLMFKYLPAKGWLKFKQGNALPGGLRILCIYRQGFEKIYSLNEFQYLPKSVQWTEL